MKNKELQNIFEKCGHFLYHRRGGKYGQQRILRAISDMHTTTQNELAEHLGLRSASVNETVKKLLANGYLLAERDERDKRRILLQLNKSGEEYLSQLQDISDKQENILFSVLSNEEQATLEKLLKKLYTDWNSKFDSSLFGHKEDERNV